MEKGGAFKNERPLCVHLGPSPVLDVSFWVLVSSHIIVYKFRKCDCTYRLLWYHFPFLLCQRANFWTLQQTLTDINLQHAVGSYNVCALSSQRWTPWLF